MHTPTRAPGIGTAVPHSLRRPLLTTHHAALGFTSAEEADAFFLAPVLGLALPPNKARAFNLNVPTQQRYITSYIVLAVAQPNAQYIFIGLTLDPSVSLQQAQRILPLYM